MSNNEVSRTKRLISISERNDKKWPAPLRSYGARTGRWSGFDKVNPQNLPSRQQDLGLKQSIIAPKGHIIIDSDSSQIEARILSWLAGEDTLTQQFADGEDVYVAMARIIFNVLDANHEISKEQRNLGKATVLGAGYGMGVSRFAQELKKSQVESENIEQLAARCIRAYRSTNRNIVGFWDECDNALGYIRKGKTRVIGARPGVATVDHDGGVVFPNGFKLRYPDLKRNPKGDYFYQSRPKTKTDPGTTKIWGSKIVENICQGIARLVIGEQMLEIRRKYRIAMTVHDSIVCVVPEKEADEAEQFITSAMSKSPAWAKDLPLACEAVVGGYYGIG